MWGKYEICRRVTKRGGRMSGIEIITKGHGEKADELRDRILVLCNEYSDIFTGFELIGIIDTVKMDCHSSIQEMDDEI